TYTLEPYSFQTKDGASVIPIFDGRTQRKKSAEDTVRLCDEAAEELCQRRIVSVTFSVSDSTRERDIQMAHIREDLKRQYSGLSEEKGL
ncbi:MAG: hypothetical protein ABIH23_21515, partial [bacterium]